MTRTRRPGDPDGSMYLRGRVKTDLLSILDEAAERSGISRSYYLELLIQHVQLSDGTMPTLEPTIDADDKELPIAAAA